MIKDAHNALLDIQSSGRAKELLGQGLLMRNMQERNAEQEKIEKRRQVSPANATSSTIQDHRTRTARGIRKFLCLSDFAEASLVFVEW